MSLKTYYAITAVLLVSIIVLCVLSFKDANGCRDLCSVFQSNKSEADSQPRVMLWAWETSSDFSWIDKDRLGVAFLAETITLSGDRIWPRARMRPLNVPDGTYLTAVVRLESDRRNPPGLADQQLSQLLLRLIARAKMPGVRSLQIDFDAAHSQRQFYLHLLKKLKEQLPRGCELSITALASWCVGDRWLNDAPVDEIVPMFFAMGADKRVVLSHLRLGAEHKRFAFLNFTRTAWREALDPAWREATHPAWREATHPAWREATHPAWREATGTSRRQAVAPGFLNIMPPASREAVGLSVDDQESLEVFANGNARQMLRGRRLYLFSSRKWTREALDRVMKELTSYETERNLETDR